jgi:hypothetical protein
MLISLVYKLVRYMAVIQVASLNRTTLYSLLSLSVHLSHVSIHGHCVTHGCPIVTTAVTRLRTQPDDLCTIFYRFMQLSADMVRFDSP